MAARQKLNQAYFMGSLFVAACAGLATQSWAIFWIALLILIAFNVHTGEIRPGRR